MKKIALVLLILGFSASHACATTWDIAQGRSSVKFKTKHLVFSHVEGKFKKFEGKVVSTQHGLSDSKMQAKIEAASIYTGNADRDKHLVGKDFFYSEKFPEIIFNSKSIKKIADHTYTITGDLTMRGVTRPIQLKATCSKEKKLSNGKTRMDLVAKGSVNRFDYGLKWNELMETGNAIVGNEVEISLKIALLRD